MEVVKIESCNDILYLKWLEKITQQNISTCSFPATHLINLKRKIEDRILTLKKLPL